MSIVIGETLLALSNVSMNYVNGTEKQVKENAKFSDQLGTTEVNNIVKEIYNKLVDCLEKCLICRHIRRFAD